MGAGPTLRTGCTTCATRAATPAFTRATEGAVEGISRDGQEVGDGEEAEFAAEEVLFAGFDVELADQAFDKQQVDGATHGEDAVGAGVGDDLDGSFFATAGAACRLACGIGDAWKSCRSGSGGCAAIGALDAGGFLGRLLGGEEGGERGGDFRDVGKLDFDEAGADLGGWLVDFLFEVDELADQRGVFGDDDGSGIGNGGDGTVGTELADDLGEGIDRFGRLDVAEGHHVGDDRIAIRQG